MIKLPLTIIPRMLMPVFLLVCFAFSSVQAATAIPSTDDDRKAVYRKAQQIILPKFEVKDVTVAEAINIVRKQAEEADPEKEGINIVLEPGINQVEIPPVVTAIPGLSMGTPAPVATRLFVTTAEMKITILLENVSLMKALQAVAGQAGYKCRIDPYAVAIVPGEGWESLVTAEYKVPTKFFASILGENKDVHPLLESMGIEFPPGATARYLIEKETLVVRQTAAGFDCIDELILDGKLPAERIEEPEEKPEYAADSPEGKRVAELKRVLKIVIPRLEFREATAREAVEWLKRKSVELDTSIPPRQTSGMLKLTSDAPGEMPNTASQIPGLQPSTGAEPAPTPSSTVTETKITLSLKNIPIYEALRYVTRMAHLKVKIEPTGIVIVPLSEPVKTTPPSPPKKEN